MERKTKQKRSQKEGWKKKVWKCNILVKCWVEDVLCPIWGRWGRLGPCAQPGGNIERNIAAYLRYFQFPLHISIAKLFWILNAILLPTFVIFNFPRIFQLQNFSEYWTQHCCLPSLFSISFAYFNCKTFLNIELNIAAYLRYFQFQFLQTMCNKLTKLGRCSTGSTWFNLGPLLHLALAYFNCKTFLNIELNIAAYLRYFWFPFSTQNFNIYLYKSGDIT